jgi:hypothetical protein
MHKNDWNKQDDFFLHLYSPSTPLEPGHEGLDAMLDFVESLDAQLRPDRVSLSRQRKYSRQLVHEKLYECRMMASTDIFLARSRPPDESLWLRTLDNGAEDSRFIVELTLKPFSTVREEGPREEYAHRFVSLVRSFAQRFPISYGLAHSYTDFSLGGDPHRTSTRQPKRVYEAYWLNVYGPRMVEEIGRERLMSVPTVHVEQLPGGAVMWLTRHTPADFDSEEARVAQARALVHLRPELKLEETLATLRQRSLVFTPIPVEFDEDVADILWLKVEALGLPERRRNVERFNSYRPPPVTEWLPAAEVPASDVDDVRREIDIYEGALCKRLIAWFHKEVPALVKGTVEALPQLDYHLWRSGKGRRSTPGEGSTDEDKERLIPMIGALLGLHLVHALGGRWVPRRKLEESAVVVGDRAWLPFLRARHALQERDAPLDYSCSQLFRVAQRLARTQVH